MSFITKAFSGVSNNYTPATTNAALETANTNYNTANTGLGSLADALKQQMMGGGPNLANAQLQQATAQNVANQAALAAGQRGAASNVGLIARQAGQQGANIQQQAAGQSAQNVLAQQLAAQAQLGGVYGTQGQLANQQAQTATGQINAANNLGASIAQQNAQMNQGLIGGLGSVVGKVSGLFADGGEVDPNAPKTILPGWGQGSNFGFNFTSMKKPSSKPTVAPTYAGPDTPSTPANNPMNNTVPVMTAAEGGEMMHGHLPFMPIDYTKGGSIKAQTPEQKAEVPGNSVKNDKIPALVSDGEVVIDKETLADKGPVGQMARAVQKHIAKRNGAKK